MKYCPKCGKPQNDNAAFCGNCGSPLPQNVQPPRPNQPQQPQQQPFQQQPNRPQQPYQQPYQQPNHPQRPQQPPYPQQPNQPQRPQQQPYQQQPNRPQQPQQQPYQQPNRQPPYPQQPNQPQRPQQQLYQQPNQAQQPQQPPYQQQPNQAQQAQQPNQQQPNQQRDHQEAIKAKDSGEVASSKIKVEEQEPEVDQSMDWEEPERKKNTILYVVIGVLVIALAVVLGIFLLNGNDGDEVKTAKTEIPTEDIDQRDEEFTEMEETEAPGYTYMDIVPGTYILTGTVAGSDIKMRLHVNGENELSGVYKYLKYPSAGVIQVKGHYSPENQECTINEFVNGNLSGTWRLTYDANGVGEFRGKMTNYKGKEYDAYLSFNNDAEDDFGYIDIDISDPTTESTLSDNRMNGNHSLQNQILSSPSVYQGNDECHFYSGSFYYNDEVYPVMIAFISNNNGIVNAFYKNVNYGSTISMTYIDQGDEISLTGIDGKNIFIITLYSDGDNGLVGKANIGNTTMSARLTPTRETFRITS